MPRRIGVHRTGAMLTAVVMVAGCGGPGSDKPQGDATGTAVSSAPACGKAPVTLKGYFETGFPTPKALTTEFTRQYANVKWNIREDQFAVITQNAPRVLADDPPDLMRLPQVSDLVKDNLLKNLDGYAKVFGWDKWPASQLEQLRMGPGGRPRGEGSLYAMGLNYSMTGVFYNKKLAARIGMSSPPATLAELDAALAKAKQAGITPIAAWNGGATGGLAFPLQNLMAAYGPPGPINDWIFQKPNATIDTPPNLTATRHLEQWIKAGYFAKDINAIDYAKNLGRFVGGQGLFLFNGDWESAKLDKDMPGNAGFFVMPPAQQGTRPAAMSAPLAFGISARAPHADCAAFFLNWVATNSRAREIAVQVGGSHPMGPAGGHMPAIGRGTLTAATLAGATQVSKDGTTMDFIANATGAIYAKSWTPQLQKLVAGKQTPEDLLKSVQNDYKSQLGS